MLYSRKSHFSLFVFRSCHWNDPYCGSDWGRCFLLSQFETPAGGIPKQSLDFRATSRTSISSNYINIDWSNMSQHRTSDWFWWKDCNTHHTILSYTQEDSLLNILHLTMWTALRSNRVSWSKYCEMPSCISTRYIIGKSSRNESALVKEQNKIKLCLLKSSFAAFTRANAATHTSSARSAYGLHTIMFYAQKALKQPKGHWPFRS